MQGRPFEVTWRREDTTEALKAAYQGERDPELRTRLHGLWLLRSGWRLPSVAAAVGVHYRTVQRWLGWYREGVVPEVVSHKMGGKGHELWRSGDAAPLIMPGSIPLYAPRVRDELLRYLNDQWNPVLDDVDGDGSEPARIDDENQRFGQVQAARRLARTIFLGSVPYKATRGVEDVRIRLGVTQPDESVSIYNDGLGRLQQRHQFLYASGQGRFWFDVQPNLTRTVADRASRVSEDDALYDLGNRLKAAKMSAGDFAGVHVCPETTEDVRDDPSARLVVLSPRHAHKRNSKESKALAEASKTLQNRGNSPRSYRNMLVFAAADEDAVSTLVEETRRHLAWVSVHKDAETLNLDRTQRRQVKEAVEKGDQNIQAQLDAAYQWALSPKQEGTNPLEWEVISLKSADLGSTGGIVQRVAYRLQSQELLILNWSPIHLKRELDQYLWKDDQPHITVKQLWTYFATYPYLSRLRDKDVLLETIRSGVVTRDFFGYANGTTEDGGYEGLTFGRPAPGVYYDDTGVVIRPEVGEEHLRKAAQDEAEGAGESREYKRKKREGVIKNGDAADTGEQQAVAAPPKRFYGTVRLDPVRISSQAGSIGQEVLQHLAALLDSNVEVTLEIEAQTPEGFPDHVVRTVTENANTLKFDNFGFEEE